MAASVLVTGASNQLGVFLLPRLQSAGYRVTALSRNAPPAPLKVSDRVRWQHPAPWAEGSGDPGHRRGCADFLVSCGPLELASALVASHAGLKRVVAFSTSSVFTKADSGNSGESRQIAGIREQETHLQDKCAERNISLILLRPTMIYGCGMDRNISLLARFGRRFGFIPVAADAGGLRQPVHADDLAAVAVLALDSGSLAGFESTVCGGSTLTYRDMVGRIALACGENIRVLSVAPRLLASAIRFAALIPPLRSINAEMVKRQAADMVFDDSALRNALNYRPRRFEPTAADFRVPEYAAQLQLST